MQRLKEFIEANPEAAADESMAAADESTAEEPAAAADAEEATEDTPAAEQAAEDTNGDEVTYLSNYNPGTTLHYQINVALFLLIFAEISCATFISHAQLLFIFENFECATFIRLRYICIAA